MTVPSSGPTESARRLWAHAHRSQSGPEAAAATAELVTAQLRLDLRRWIGEAGYRSLLERSLTEVRPAHPALATVSCLGTGGSEMNTAELEHGAEAIEAAVLALVTVLIEMLGRILGDDLAARLVEQSGSEQSADDRNHTFLGDLDG